MPPAQGSVRYIQNNHTLTLRVEGRGVMGVSLPMRRCAERHIGRGVDEVRIDLRHCTHMDSTFVGTLLTLKKTLESQHGRLTLVMPSLACAKILQQMGLEETLPAEAAELDDAAAWLAIGPEDDEKAFRSNATEAHENLAELPGPIGEQFKRVVRCLEDTAKKDKPPE